MTHDRINVGFTGNIYRECSCARCLMPILDYLDRSRFVPHIYSDSTSHGGHDRFTTRFQAHTRWQDTSSLNGSQWAQRIIEDKIDIIVDPMGHKQGNRIPDILEHLPLIKHTTYIGYPSSYPSSHGNPSGDDFTNHYSVNIDDIGWAYEAIPAPEITPVPSLTNFITFGSFHRAAKITREVQCLWGKLLCLLPTARLIVVVLGGEKNIRARQTLESNGIDKRRLFLFDKAPTRADYLARSSQIDIHLDTFPYSGGATTFDMLWMGVPVVSMDSPFHIGKHILESVGLAWNVARSEEEYISKAIEIANDQANGQAARLNLRNAIESLGPTITRRFEERLTQLVF